MKVFARIVNDNVEVEIDKYEVLSEMLCDLDVATKDAVKCSLRTMDHILGKISDEMIASFSPEIRDNIYDVMMEHIERWKGGEHGN